MIKLRHLSLKVVTLTTFAISIVSCSNDISVDNTGIENAQKVLGITIPSDQDWNMVGTVTPNITVYADYGETYTVKVYENNPFAANQGTVLAKGTVSNGGSFTTPFEYPLADSILYAAYVDSKGYTYVQPVSVVNKTITATFGSASIASSKTQTTTRATSNDIPTMDVPKVDSYLDGATEITDDNASDNNLDAEKLKITGNCTKNIAILGWKATSLYISGTWTLPADQAWGGQATIIVANGGKINIPAGRTLNSPSSGKLIVMPGGTISGEGNLTFSTSIATSYNGGDISTNTFATTAGDFYNYGTLTTNTFNGGGSTIINHKKITVEDNFTAYSASILNACWFECKNAMTAQTIVVGNNAYLHAGSLSMASQGTITLGNDAILDETRDFTPNGTTINGPTSGDYAFLQLGNFEPTWYAVNSITGNIYVSLDDPANENWLTGNVPYNTNAIFKGNATLINKGQAKVNFDASECTVGYNPAKPTPVEDDHKTYTYAFEDNPTGDYDLNDVVLQVKVDTIDNSKLDVALVAVGASYKIHAFLGDTPLFGGKEVHDVFNITDGSKVNTYSYNTTPITTVINKPANFTFEGADFYITTEKGDKIALATAGQDPHAICVPGEWDYPKETICVKDAYKDFIEFAKHSDHKTLPGWYKNPVSGKVIELMTKNSVKK
jgi:hypothetical protein